MLYYIQIHASYKPKLFVDFEWYWTMCVDNRKKYIYIGGNGGNAITDVCTWEHFSQLDILHICMKTNQLKEIMLQFVGGHVI